MPSLLCLLDSWGDLSYTSHGLLTGPEAWWWDGITYLEFAMHGHSGESWVVEASGAEAPPVLHGFLDPELAQPADKCLSAFILEQVQTGISQGTQIYEHHRCYAYHVRLVPLPGGPIEDLVEINAYAGQSVRELAAQRYPERQVLSTRRQSRFI